MKRNILLSTLFIVMQICNFTVFGIDVTTEDPEDPRIRSLTIIPVAADYSVPDLSTEFLYNVGTSTITVTDDSGAVVYHTTVYASVGTTVTTSTEFWDSGTYKITIQIGTKSYSGYFNVVN